MDDRSPELAQPTRSDLGDELRDLRESRDLSRRQLAKAVGLQPATVASIERGNRTLATTVHRWLEACGIDDPDDRERWIDPYRLMLSDSRREVRQGEATLREYVHVITKCGHPRRFESPAVTSYHPAHAEQFRIAVQRAKEAMTEIQREEVEALRARAERRIEILRRRGLVGR